MEEKIIDSRSTDKVKIGKYELNKNEVVNIQSKNHICYAGLLRLAHENGLRSIQVEKISSIPEGAMCHVKSHFMIDGKDHFFDGIGTGTVNNLKAFTKVYPFEMAQTRAKARALRDALNIGDAAAEEISDWKKKTDEYN